MDLVALTFASGWTSGINAYGTVLVLGLLGRFAGVAEVPAGLQRTDVLIVMTVLATLEFFADKIPYLDSIWDGISTIIRPLAGAVIGALIAGASGDLSTVALASIGGVTALISHGIKAGLRLAANTSPEPITNIGLSLTGDVAVISVASLAALYPIPAAIIAAILLAATAIVLVFVFSRIKKGWLALRSWLARP
jgi:hypothetical protein